MVSMALQTMTATDRRRVSLSLSKAVQSEYQLTRLRQAQTDISNPSSSISAIHFTLLSTHTPLHCQRGFTDAAL